MKKKMIGLWIGTIAIGMIFSGCGSVNHSGNDNPSPTKVNASISGETGTTENTLPSAGESKILPENCETISLKIVDGAKEGDLVLAGKGVNEVYTLSVKDIPVYLDGTAADASVLEDLWETDPGLNSNSQYISVDLSQAPGDLTEGEKSAIAWIFSSRHNAQMLTLSYEELTEQGYVKDLTFEKGILFCIKNSNDQKNIFDASKWCSGDGAIFFNHCQVIRSESGSWKDYKVGDFAIS